MYRYTFGGDLLQKQDAWGQFGDFIGGILNPVVGLITLLLLVRTLELQRKELQEQRQEISRQNDILARQSVEQALFAWIKDYKAEVAAFEYSIYDEYEGEDTVYKGMNALRALIRNCTGRPVPIQSSETLSIIRQRARAGPPTATECNATLRRCIERWEESRGYDKENLEGLLRTLYGLFKWIDRTSLSWEAKFEYASIVRARLSTTELNMLFLNGHTKKGTRFVRYIHRYALFDNYHTSGDRALDEARHAPDCRYSMEAYNSELARARRNRAVKRLEQHNAGGIT